MEDPQLGWNLQILARTIYGEARGENQTGREAIAAVVNNRVMAQHTHDTGKRWGRTVAEVCLREAQFSCWHEHDENFRVIVAVSPGVLAFMECLQIALRACHGFVKDNTGGADHFHTAGTKPPWIEAVVHTVTLGKHLFYRELSRDPSPDPGHRHPASP